MEEEGKWVSPGTSHWHALIEQGGMAKNFNIGSSVITSRTSLQ